jgi:hypothetical protein
MGMISAGTPSRRHPSPIGTIVGARLAQGKPQGFQLSHQDLRSVAPCSQEFGRLLELDE